MIEVAETWYGDGTRHKTPKLWRHHIRVLHESRCYKIKKITIAADILFATSLKEWMLILETNIFVSIINMKLRNLITYLEKSIFWKN